VTLKLSSTLVVCCVSACQSIVGRNVYMPLDSRLINKAGIVCFKSVNFGVSSVVVALSF